MRLGIFMLSGALALAACRKSDPANKDKDKKAEPAPTATAESKKSARPEPQPVDEGIDVPTEEDFEEAVSTQITPESDLGKELDGLEKEIGK